MKLEKDRELIERVAKALFELADEMEPSVMYPTWESLPEEHKVVIDKNYYRERADKAVYPDV